MRTPSVDMKFDLVIGNPPYGKNASLALKFLNHSRNLSNNIYFVLPRTFRKPSVVNRVDVYLALQSDRDVSDDQFPGTISACHQHWQVSTTARPIIATLTTHEDFEFVDKSHADVALGRVGGGPCGKVFTDFQSRSANSHYFLKVKNSAVIDRLRSLEKVFRQSASQTVGCPSLSKHDLIETYQNNRGTT